MNEKMKGIILRKVEDFIEFKQFKELVFVLKFMFCLTENRCTSYRRILRVDVRYLKELWIWLHPFLSVPGLREPRWRETFCLISSLVIWERIKHQFSKKREMQEAQGAVAHFAHSKAKTGLTRSSYRGSWLICSGIMLSAQFHTTRQWNQRYQLLL